MKSKNIKGKVILNNINLKIEKGKIYGLQGANGAGKTMLLRLICDLIKPTSGEVRIKRGATFGVVIENLGFLFNETAYNNLKYLANINKKIGDAEIESVLEKVGLADNKNTKVKKFSLGMLQKLGIAQAIMENPDILLLDEPFNALDSKSIEAVKALLLDLRNNGTAIVIAAHNLDLVIEDCNTIFVKEDGYLTESIKMPS